MSNSCSEEGKIVYRLYEISKQTSPKFERCTGISQSRLDILNKLYEIEEISQTELQKEVNIDHAAVTRHLKQLEEKGMVSRRKNPADNRFTFVRLTDEGRTKIIAYQDEKQRFISKVLTGFTEKERSSLLEMLTRIQDNVKNIHPND
ncbi:MarR family winged helix-turn-helix transcriptional regulator [Paenisporosarcina sp. OV554]|uniref:MarR family winged helix-turn-helix transcriptional regulator n=1 Tax=Paenisporosarcina sp. OV554 TaxID=2135694 RepID=UPI000D373C2F|nr:MarR family transcriptional regulator [Paenisporosarcina sp. OV554]PUB11714.1 MarR family transcriptional regulator [Paenisporosarcina sp. OV554]